MKTSIAIIGAGIAGITLGRNLSGLADITVFEKSRGLGGRMANRRREGFSFDHGAQYFTARSPAFKAAAEQAVAQGHADIWPRAVHTLTTNGLVADSRPTEPRYIGIPGMSGFANGLAEGLEIRKEASVARLAPSGNGWALSDNEDRHLGHFDLVISTAPAPQTIRLMPETFSAHAALKTVKMSGCFTLMIGLDAQLDLGFEAARIEDPVLSWIAIEASKPGRSEKTALTIHSRNDWAEANLERDRGEVQAEMLQSLKRLLGKNFSTPAWLDLHRWRYANVERPVGQPFLFDPALGLGACGDWCLGNRVEAAVESALALSEILIARLQGA
ncbi:amine oxidoreductase [Rhizobium rosettiformans]|uniref:Amine oxidoreductase n=1 Tax=Rhizobium rosettiformans TaxID=1368430 RepID=A0ABX7ESV4_9HYPH|nr:FAD-dependent oxidoreductase [Rhizobium rosettiformans]QRF50343.1 amine oxidoreductase [Rhizobium rosettiformans]